MVSPATTSRQRIGRIARAALSLVWPIAICYWAFSLVGPHPVRRTLMLLAAIVILPIVLIGPVAIVRRRRLQALALRWQKVWHR